MQKIYRYRSYITHMAWMVGCVVLLAGCTSKGPETFPVKGKVLYQDGSPMKEGMVEFESLEEGEYKGRNARGKIEEDGSYFLSTEEEGDGAVVGKHRAIVREPYRDVDIFEGEKMPDPIIDRSYANYDTAGLEYVVEEKENEIEIKVARPGRRP